MRYALESDGFMSKSISESNGGKTAEKLNFSYFNTLTSDRSLYLFFTQNLDDVTRYKINILDLNDDCLYIIFKKLSYAELMGLSEIPKFVPAISMILKQQFNKLTVTIRGVVDCNNHHLYGKSEYSDMHAFDQIWIECYPTQVAVLQRFGHLIENLKIQPFNRWPEENIERIFEILKLHCSETLKTVNFCIDENTYNKLNVSFKVAETVTLMSNTYNNEMFSLGLDFNRRFPAIRKLYVDSFNFLSSSRINITDYKIPHLMHIERKQLDHDKIFEVDLNGTQFGDIIKSNPQITSIALVDCNGKSLQFLSLHAVNLENLEFRSYLHDTYPEIRFDKLKKLKMGGRIGKSFIMPPPFACDKLEELTVVNRAELASILAFVRGKVNFKKLHYNGSFNKGQILNDLPKMNLHEVTFYHYIDTKAEDIIEFIKKSPNLKILQLLIHDSSERRKLYNEIAEILPSFLIEWTVKNEINIILSKKTIQ